MLKFKTQTSAGEYYQPVSFISSVNFCITYEYFLLEVHLPIIKNSFKTVVLKLSSALESPRGLVKIQIAYE